MDLFFNADLSLEMSAMPEQMGLFRDNAEYVVIRIFCAFYAPNKNPAQFNCAGFFSWAIFYCLLNALTVRGRLSRAQLIVGKNLRFPHRDARE